MRRHQLTKVMMAVAAIATIPWPTAGHGAETPTVILTYELGGCESTTAHPVEAAGEKPNVGEHRFGVDDLVASLNKRVGRHGKAVAQGSTQIRVDLYGELNKRRLDSIKERIGGIGCLEFRILASSAFAEDKSVIESAKLLSLKKREVLHDGRVVAKWLPYAEKEFGPIDRPDRGVVKRMAESVPQALVLIDDHNITGTYVTSATKGIDSQGKSAIHFTLDEEGAKKFRKLTSENSPDAEKPDLVRYLGVIMDEELLSAPAIQGAISDRGMISGASMTDEEVESMVTALNRGSLPKVVRLVDEKRVGQEK
jgi:SecD/SecF fusion protein